MVPRIGRRLVRGRYVPDSDRAIVTSAGQLPGIRPQDYASHGAVGGVPDFDNAVGARGRELLSVRMERDRIDGEDVPAHNVPFLAGIDVPETNGAVGGGRGQELAVGAKCDVKQSA